MINALYWLGCFKSLISHLFKSPVPIKTLSKTKTT
jgi:hypothetical protein